MLVGQQLHCLPAPETSCWVSASIAIMPKLANHSNIIGSWDHNQTKLKNKCWVFVNMYSLVVPWTKGALHNSLSRLYCRWIVRDINIFHFRCRLAFYAVFDGHGGARASKHAAEYLHMSLAKRFPKGNPL